MSPEMNLEKQIKRHVIAQNHDFFALTHPGFESVCENEICRLGEGPAVQERVKGGVAFRGRITDLYAANLHVRTAGRLLMRIARFKTTNFHHLVRRTAAIAWARYLPWGAIPEFRVTARHSRLFHSQAVAAHMGGAIESYWQQMGTVAAHTPDQSLWVRIEDDYLTLSMDSSGHFLYRRGLKTHPGRAPIRETLAAAILMAAGFRGDRSLIDPMCGSGTFALEAALLAKQVPPGLSREFAFMRWPSFRPRQWQYLKSQAVDAVKICPQPMIWASDIDAAACQALSRCIAVNGLQDAVHVRRGDFFQLEPDQIVGKSGPGLVVLNPPYGRRLRPPEGLDRFYAAIGNKLSTSFKGWRTAVLVPGAELIANLPAGLSFRHLTHGGQTLTLATGTIG